jgi:hypothetical protein
VRKGAYLYLGLVVYVEGEQEPPEDFVAEAEAVVREILAAGRSQRRPDWRVEIQRLDETEMPGEWD